MLDKGRRAIMSDYEEFVKRMGSFDMELSLDDVGPNKNELIHYGVLGMKWGVRRFQNRDGSRTTLGKRRSKEELVALKKSTSAASQIAGEGKKITKSMGNIKLTKQAVDLSSMTDDELKKRVNRMNMEQQFLNLAANASVSKGQKYTEEIMEVAGSVLTITSSSLAIALAIKELKG